MTKESLVSVLIPCYNGEKFLRQSIDSVINQTYRNIEIIIIDDGSTDNSVQLAKSFNDNRIQILEQQNSGVSAARNTGIINSKGNYILLLDADDQLQSKVIERRVQLLKENTNAGLILGHFAFIDEHNQVLEVSTRQRKIPKQDTFHYLIRKSFGPLAAIFKREVITHCGFFDPILQGSEDRDFFIRCSKKFEVIYDPEIGGYYRENSHSSSRNIDHMIREAKKMFKKNGILSDHKIRYFFSKLIGLAHVYNFYFRRLMFETGIEKKTPVLSKMREYFILSFKYPELILLGPLLAMRVFLEKMNVVKRAYPFIEASNVTTKVNK